MNSDFDYSLKIDFEPDSEEPERVFLAMADLINAFQVLDEDLAHCISVSIEPRLLLLDIEAGSLIAKLRTILNEVDDEALKKLDWKPQVGKYLVTAKKKIVAWLEKKEGVSDRKEIRQIQAEIQQAAEEADVLHVPIYHPIGEGTLLVDLKMVTSAVAPLNEKDLVEFITDDFRIPLNKSFNVSQETIETLLTDRVLNTKSEMILKVKKPDFLGQSQWILKHARRTIHAKIIHYEWLHQYQNGDVELLPGDSIRCMVKQKVHYDNQGQVIGDHAWVVEVLEVIKQASHANAGLSVDSDTDNDD